ncbi:VLRF1 family aeRF1-type release factor [Deinococcus pimensis]|uniref:VLRF1 family aeRF1-type release factor n=1 Tax=Deinococcus pimensis TaxID=309888 RepID=UPI0004888306|nr:VLRF1 family aeRF1-type release factor [Deinococcus pimensis]
MLTEQEIERIKSLPEDGNVLMAVVNVNPAVVDNEGSGLQTRAKSMMQQEGIPPTIMARVLDDLAESRTTFGKSAVYVVNEDMFERYDVQVDLPERFHYGRPVKSMIANILEMMPKVGVLAVDREFARFFVLEQGELTEIRRRENVRLDDGDRWDTVVSGTRHVPGAPGSGGAGRGQPGSGPRSDSGYDLFEAREAAAQQRFYNDMQKQVTKLMGHYGLKHIILVGPVQRVADFKAEIPDKAPYEVLGSTNVSAGTGWADPAQILEKVSPMLDELRTQQEEELMHRIQEEGVMEVERVLQMIQQGQIYMLIIPEDGSRMHVYRSHNREVPYFTSKETAHSPLDDSLMERVTLDEVLPDFVTLYGVDVRRLRGDNADRLVRQFGGLAGLPRF